MGRRVWYSENMKQLTQEQSDELRKTIVGRTASPETINGILEFIKANTERKLPAWYNLGLAITPRELKQTADNINKFGWIATPEGTNFWSTVYKALNRMSEELDAAN